MILQMQLALPSLTPSLFVLGHLQIDVELLSIKTGPLGYRTKLVEG